MSDMSAWFACQGVSGAPAVTPRTPTNHTVLAKIAPPIVHLDAVTARSVQTAGLAVVHALGTKELFQGSQNQTKSTMLPRLPVMSVAPRRL